MAGTVYWWKKQVWVSWNALGAEGPLLTVHSACLLSFRIILCWIIVIWWAGYEPLHKSKKSTFQVNLQAKNTFAVCGFILGSEITKALWGRTALGPVLVNPSLCPASTFNLQLTRLAQTQEHAIVTLDTEAQTECLQRQRFGIVWDLSIEIATSLASISASWTDRKGI